MAVTSTKLIPFISVFPRPDFILPYLIVPEKRASLASTSNRNFFPDSAIPFPDADCPRRPPSLPFFPPSYLLPVLPFPCPSPLSSFPSFHLFSLLSSPCLPVSPSPSLPLSRTTLARGLFVFIIILGDISDAHRAAFPD